MQQSFPQGAIGARGVNQPLQLHPAATMTVGTNNLTSEY
jgi:hypothetical protein